MSEKEKITDNISELVKILKKEKTDPLEFGVIRELRKTVKKIKGKKSETYHICKSDTFSELLFEISSFLIYLIGISEKEDITFSYKANTKNDDEKYICPGFVFQWKE